MNTLALVFPGQGSQSVGMLNAIADNAIVKATMAEADEALGFSLSGLIANGPAEDLGLTLNTQPAMLAACIAIYRVYIASNRREICALSGHSLGEYTALVASGVLDFADALKAVRYRASAMQAAVPAGVGGMAAVLGLDDAQVKAVCAELQAQGLTVEAANFNDPKQTVISGEKQAVEQACEKLKAAGAKRAVMLAVSAPFHSSLMKPAADKLRDYLAGVRFNTPQVPVINNIDVASETDANKIRDALYRQAFGPVRWSETVAALRARGVTTVIECGPGKVLAGLVKRCDAQLAVHAMYDPATVDAALAIVV
jgi:[acyl-carrier-protein] S-malonyltransferase